MMPFMNKLEILPGVSQRAYSLRYSVTQTKDESCGHPEKKEIRGKKRKKKKKKRKGEVRMIGMKVTLHLV